MRLLGSHEEMATECDMLVTVIGRQASSNTPSAVQMSARAREERSLGLLDGLYAYALRNTEFRHHADKRGLLTCGIIPCLFFTTGFFVAAVT